MHASAMNQIVEYFSLFEGSSKNNPITWMYLDERALVTTGVGILLDPLESNKHKVKFFRKTATGQAGPEPATDSELKAEFDLVKSKSEPVPDKAGERRPLSDFAHYKAFEPITNLRIQETAIAGSALGMVTKIDQVVRREFGPDYDDWPADVQVVIVQMAYGGGLEARKKEGLLFPLLKKRNWYEARSYTYLSNPKSGRDGYIKYNRAFDFLMLNGWIIDRCRELGSRMVYPAPKDHTVFYGLKNCLGVSRWNRESMTPEIRPDDIITGGDITKWLEAWTIRTLRDRLKKK
ncbi:MAG TPA: hypothetical protein PKY50_15340 [Candidatus Competibacter sp.]|nr:hypothetical protein [Candidatus Competibacter sp.]